MTEENCKQNCKEELKSEKLTRLSEAVKSLYQFRDHYFENHNEKDACNKASDLKRKLDETLLLFEENKDVQPKERAEYFYLKGKALNVTPEYDAKAEEALSRSIKLDIKLYEAWNELGESYWKKNDIVEAKNCFHGALKHHKNQISLRNLSMVMRMEKPENFECRIKNIEEGIKFAKEAVELDPTDGASWSVLGNAYLSSFFNIAQHPSVLSLCKSAYTQAEKDAIARNNPDLHYNKAVIAKYEENYAAALNSFVQAYKLDPLWEDPKNKKLQLLNYLSKVNDLYREKGKIKGKKLYKMLSNLNPEKNLGPYKGGKYKVKSGKELKLNPSSFHELKEGLNKETVVLGVVVCSVQDEDNVPFTFIMVDKFESSIVVTVYNLAQEKGVLIGDYVAIPEPLLTEVSFKFEDKEYSYRTLRVITPLIMVVNGRKLDRSKESGLQFSTFAIAD